jgi:hypothetical protein
MREKPWNPDLLFEKAVGMLVEFLIWVEKDCPGYMNRAKTKNVPIREGTFKQVHSALQRLYNLRICGVDGVPKSLLQYDLYSRKYNQILLSFRTKEGKNGKGQGRQCPQLGIGNKTFDDAGLDRVIWVMLNNPNVIATRDMSMLTMTLATANRCHDSRQILLSCLMPPVCLTYISKFGWMGCLCIILIGFFSVNQV